MAKKDIAVGDNSLSLADIGLAYTKATRLYDKNSLDEKENLIPSLEEKFGITEKEANKDVILLLMTLTKRHLLEEE
jgi:hypothetical protein